MKTLDIIKKCAAIPSFSSYEEIIHPTIYEICEASGINPKVENVPDNNLLIYVPGKRNCPPVALTAHLDKIDHWEGTSPEILPVAIEGEQIRGVMDDTVGLGICLQMLFQSKKHHFPPLLLLFSEMEESCGLRNHPHLLRNGGEGLTTGMGAERLASKLIKDNNLPSMVVTIDTTPEFKEEPGICFYDSFWHRSKDFTPSSSLLSKIDNIKQFFVKKHPQIVISNANNDYLEYGLTLNQNKENEIPSIALEPAIFPYHQKYEGVHCSDIAKIEELLIDFLENFNFSVV